MVVGRRWGSNTRHIYIYIRHKRQCGTYLQQHPKDIRIWEDCGTKELNLKLYLLYYCEGILCMYFFSRFISLWCLQHVNLNIYIVYVSCMFYYLCYFFVVLSF